MLPSLPLLALDTKDENKTWLIVLIVSLVVGVFVLFVFFSFVRLWIQSLLTGAGSAS